jgi:hypothetical protein
LSDKEREDWINEFKVKTNCDFKVVTAEQENDYTVYGALQNCNIKEPVAVMIGGGGSTELSIVEDGKIIEKRHYSFGAQDITDRFPDLAEDKVKTDFNEMIEYAHSLIDGLESKAKYMILTGGDYLTFYQKLGFPLVDNNLFKDDREPFMIDSDSMEEFDKKYFYEMSLDKVIEENGNPNWWKCTRGMRVCVTMLVRYLECDYIIPTRIGMLYGIVNEILKEKDK